jgi:hypothetical protein
MKKSILLILLALLLKLNIHAQCTWQTVGDTLNFSIKSILPDISTSFIAGGTFTKIGSYSVAGIAQWNGASWTKIAGSGIVGSEVKALTRYGNGYVAGGTFSMIDSVYCNNVGYYDGMSWSPLGSGLDYTGGVTVSTLVVHNSDLYAAGSFITSSGTTLNHVAKWNGSTWVPLGSGITGTVNALCSYNGKLYAAGTFTNAGGVSVHNIAVWDGNSWGDVNGGVNAYTGGVTVSTLTVFNGELYAGGTFEIAGADSISNIARWNDNDSTWSDVGGGLAYTGAVTVSTISMNEVNKALIVSASYRPVSSPDLIYELQSWDGTSWSVLDGETSRPVEALASVSDAIVIGGQFRGIGSATMINYLGAWACGGGKMMTALTQTQQPEKRMFELYPNPVEDKLYLDLTPDADDMREDAFRFTLNDITGRQVCTAVIKGTDPKFERAGIPAGMYYYDLQNLSTGNIQKGKVVFK